MFPIRGLMLSTKSGNNFPVFHFNNPVCFGGKIMIMRDHEHGDAEIDSMLLGTARGSDLRVDDAAQRGQVC